MFLDPVTLMLRFGALETTARGVHGLPESSYIIYINESAALPTISNNIKLLCKPTLSTQPYYGQRAVPYAQITWRYVCNIMINYKHTDNLVQELRNRIYNDLLAKEPAISYKDADSQLHLWDHPQLSHTRRKDPSSSFGLTQACYQLRKEFFPLHRATFPSYRTTIPLEWLREGLNTFRYDIAGNPMTPNAKIRVRLPTTPETLATLDLKELILSSTIEGFTFIMTPYRGATDPFFDFPKDLFLRADARPRWLRYIKDRASQVFVQRSEQTGCYRIFVTMEHCNMESWMRKRHIPLDDARLLRWRRELGVPEHLLIFPVRADPAV